MAKKAIGAIILEIKGLTDIADYFVICSGTSFIQMKTIADNIVEKLAEKEIKPIHYEINKDSKWLVLDYVDVIVHIFEQEIRDYYRLEQLWGDARVIKPRESKKKKAEKK